ncbi:MAG: bifunctional riboflavin kinase/FAD synthetase [Bacteroidia bacterium]|nr:bifunctional riboflavin kinase/FAD synthetase [Bacteroidia bacterium]
MLVIKNTPDFRIEIPTIVTIGTFDGVHLGHQKILNRIAEIKSQTGLKTVVLTFDPHPRKVLFPDQKDLKLLTGIEERLELLEKNGIDIAVVYPFSRHFAQTESSFYIEQILLKQLHVKYLAIGHDHRFGKNRSGNLETLVDYSRRFQFQLEEISAKDIDQIAISSSKIRKALEEGQLDLANAYLGHPYFITALVVKGKQLGRQLGYPTANLFLENHEKIVPANGVYFVEVDMEGARYHGMMNVGMNPTTDNNKVVKLEVNIFNFEAEIYNKHLTVRFLKRLRNEESFKDLEALKAQLKRDEAACFNLISEYK